MERICTGAFENCSKLENFELEEDSKLPGAFAFAKLRSFQIPPRYEMFEKDLFKNLYLLEKVSFHPKNQNFKSIDDNRVLLGKSNPKSDVFDILLFVCRKEYKFLTIPSSVRIINSFAFNGCDRKNS